MENINELAYKIIGCAYEVHKTLGVGLLESTYETCLCYEFDKAGIKYERQKELPVYYKEMKLDNGYRMDILVESLLPIHTAQIMTYLKLSKHHLGLLINFNITNLQNGIKRYVI